MASKDGLAADIVQANIMNWDALSVNYLWNIAQSGKAGNGDTKNITVRGLKVDDIRTDFAGNKPQIGEMIAASRRAVPELKIMSAEFDGDNINLKLDISDNTDKLDIYINGEYDSSVSDNMTELKINAANFDSDTLGVAVYSYTHYMFHAAASVDLAAGAGAVYPNAEIDEAEAETDEPEAAGIDDDIQPEPNDIDSNSRGFPAAIIIASSALAGSAVAVFLVMKKKRGQ